jgi:hypothetical protein
VVVDTSVVVVEQAVEVEVEEVEEVELVYPTLPSTALE